MGGNIHEERGENKHEGWMLPLGERLAYIFDTGATQNFNTFVSMFLAAYLLMIGVDPKISAVVVLFVKIWDAANDAIFGFMVDKISHLSPVSEIDNGAVVISMNMTVATASADRTGLQSRL